MPDHQLKDKYKISSEFCANLAQMESGLLIRNVHQQVSNLLTDELPESMYFHDMRHTYDVLFVSTQIALASKLPHDELLVLQLAALFHDTGYCYAYGGHEEQSKLIAANYLLQEECSEELIDAVTGAIGATRVPQLPQNDVQRILCDADLFHFSQTGYPGYAERLRQEWVVHLGKQFTDAEWNALNLALLQKHRYFTIYGQDILENGKQKNIQLLSQ